MAKHEDHCRDCELMLGDRHEEVNRWMDELFRKHGPNHRRHRHCWAGVREAKRLWGPDGARAAVVHIVRDCGAVPRARDYDETNLGIVLAPEFLAHDGLERARDKFERAVRAEWARCDAMLGVE